MGMRDGQAGEDIGKRYRRGTESAFLPGKPGPVNKGHWKKYAFDHEMNSHRGDHAFVHRYSHSIKMHTPGQRFSPELWERGLQWLVVLRFGRVDTGDMASNPRCWLGTGTLWSRPTALHFAPLWIASMECVPLTFACVYFFWRKWGYFSNNF